MRGLKWGLLELKPHGIVRLSRGPVLSWSLREWVDLSRSIQK
jgi:hypothetical protein